MADAPINIPISSAATNCQGTCSLNFTYTDSVCNANTALKHAISIPAYEHNSQMSVRYRGISYTPSKIEIYNGSLHTYSGSRAEAELMVWHNGTGGDGAGKTLIISVPITSSGASDAGAGAIVDRIMAQTTTNATASSPVSVNFSDGTNPIKTFNLKMLIPSQKPFFTYLAKPPYATSGPVVNYVVFPRNSTAVITVSSAAMAAFKNNTKQYVPPTSSMPVASVSYNAVGANAGSAGPSDNLYIDCSPAGDDGVVLYKQGVMADGTTTGDFKMAEQATGSLSETNILESDIFITIVQFVVAALLAFIIVYIAYALYKFFASLSGNKQVEAATN
jgi:hypothetical protein